MKIKNLKISEHINEIVGISLVIGSIACCGLYYNYENTEQIEEVDLDVDNFINEGENISYLFKPGEHSIRISRNDAFSYTFEQVDGYKIVSVKTKGTLNNCQVTYVNAEPVIAQATSEKDGEYEFNDFGKVFKEKEKKK